MPMYWDDHAHNRSTADTASGVYLIEPAQCPVPHLGYNYAIKFYDLRSWSIVDFAATLNDAKQRAERDHARASLRRAQRGGI
jgi:hypothetical protein